MALLPLGLISQGGGANGGGAFELISTQVLASNTSSVTFSSISSTYKHLQLRMTTRTDASSADIVTLVFNGDSTETNYRQHYLLGTGSSVATISGNNNRLITYTADNSLTSGVFNSAVVDVLDYGNTNKNTTIRALFGTSASGYYVGLSSLLWMNTAAVTSITLSKVVGTNFVTGSRFSLYGIKGS